MNSKNNINKIVMLFLLLFTDINSMRVTPLGLSSSRNMFHTLYQGVINPPVTLLPQYPDYPIIISEMVTIPQPVDVGGVVDTIPEISGIGIGMSEVAPGIAGTGSDSALSTSSQPLTSALESKLNGINTQTLAVLGLISAASLYGIYKYHQAYIKPTPELIDESLEFVGRLIDDPLFFYRAEPPVPSATRRSSTPRSITENTQQFVQIPQLLAHKKMVILRALGLTESYLNTKSYLLSRLVKTEREQVFTLFNFLDQAGKESISFLNGEFDTSALKQEIINGALKIYLSLLQARNVYKPDTLTMLLRRINQDIRFNMSPAIFGKDEKVQEVYLQLKSYMARPLQFYKDRSVSTPVDIPLTNTQVLNLKNELIYKMYGGDVYRWLFLSKETKEKSAEFEKLFDRLQKSIASNDSSIRDSIISQAITCCNILIEQLSNVSKWLIVKEYLEATHKSFSFE